MESLNYRLSILQAEAGYGKSTALAELVDEVDALAWYQIHEEDSDPLIFLLHLCHAFLKAMPDLYKKINRPHPEATFARLVDGLIAFREEYQGKLWIEVMLIRDLNDTESALKEIAATLQRIQPDEVHIIQPTRPPVETWVEPPDEEGL